MKFKVSLLGNRVCIKTQKRTYCKVTYLTVEDARKTIKNIINNGWTIDFNKETIDLI